MRKVVLGFALFVYMVEFIPVLYTDLKLPWQQMFSRFEGVCCPFSLFRETKSETYASYVLVCTIQKAVVYDILFYSI